MWCCKCNRDLSECVCPDIKERLNAVAGMGSFVYRKCNKCGEHYSRCKCPEPGWVVEGLKTKAPPRKEGA